MANWKVLGEVPDSDDDAEFDSQETDVIPIPALEPAPPTLEQRPVAVHSEQRSIWDIPDSSPVQETRKQGPTERPKTPISSAAPATALVSSPLSSIPDDAFDNDELDEFHSQFPAGGTELLRKTPVTTRNYAEGSPDPLDFTQDDVSRSFVELTQAPPDFLLDKDADEPSEPKPIQAQQPRSQSPVTLGTQAETEFASPSTAALQYGRALRPRKPIQQHPYLIENVQYSKALRSAGVKPVRVDTEEERLRKRKAAEEDSQEQEFEADSQSIASGVGPYTASEDNTQSADDNQQESFPRLFSTPPDHRTSSPKPRGLLSSPYSRSRETDLTSPFMIDEDDDDGFPSLDILPNLSKKILSREKRPSCSTKSSARKKYRRNPMGSTSVPTTLDGKTPPRPLARIDLLESSPERPLTTLNREPNVVFEEGSETPKQHRAVLTEPRHQSPLVTTTRQIFDLTTEDDEPALVGEAGSVASNASGSDSENSVDITRFRRRARGVLPASHFRLDQSVNQANLRQKAQIRPLETTTDAIQRRGLAVRRTGTSRPQPASVFPFEVSDESDIERNEAPPISTEPPLVQTVLHLEDSDNGSGAEEYDEIDHMTQRSKRRLDRNSSYSNTSKRRKTLHTPSGKRREQQTITSHFSSRNRQPSTSRRNTSTTHPARGPQKRRSKQTKLSKAPPQIGILDVIEPSAPQFLKIAARTAKRRAHKGRTTPRTKKICLGTREDQIDAGTVLHNWTSGKIQPRSTVQPTRRDVVPKMGRRPLQHISQNLQKRSPEAIRDGPPTDPKSKHGAPILNSTLDRHHQARHPDRNKTPTPDTPVRPAQLEADLLTQPGRLAFHSKKRMLDVLYRQNVRRASSPSIILSLGSVDAPPNASHDTDSVLFPAELDEISASPPPEPVARRRKKMARPRRIDTKAAQYRHANDPLPLDSPAPVESEVAEVSDGKLLGLGPFGTQYSQHFERFPLERGIFFHEETLLGSGCVRAALDKSYADRVFQVRPRVFFSLSGQSLRWGPWNDDVSSEFGILCDTILNQLVAPDTPDDPQLDAKGAARFIRSYIQDAFSVSPDSEAESFISRLVDVFGSFLSRLQTELSHLSPRRLQVVLEILCQLLVATASGVNLCKNVDVLSSEMMRMELLLQKMSATCVSCLLGVGFGPIAKLQDDLRRLAFRQRGIRADNVAAVTWVILMTVLGDFQIPRMSFWDVTYSVLIKAEVKSGVNARTFEQLWENVFTLLPLCEFDNMGVVTSGSRYRISMDGWALPQLVLKRVFQLYKDNSRQSPSFNIYCRALLSRCHYLVEQWGWQKCSGIVGTIFDFFGSQNLSHLRNEVVYRSPAFLESLHLNPSLQVEPEDRCFHVFLKLIAVAIKQLVRSGSTNEVRNLVARTLPNHNRQYLKEHNVHQDDLGALRNHHDLLCTLYWATPPDLRPATLIQLLKQLVIPASSHKEACLINLRAWGQTARFVASKGSASEFKALYWWQTDTFQELLGQYDSVAADINQQMRNMSSDSSVGISQDLINGVIASNKLATMDVLICSTRLSLNTARYARSLELAILAANNYQIKQVLRRFSTAEPEFPWTILRDTLATLELLLDRTERALGDDKQRENEETLNETSVDDSIMLLDREITADFYAMARSVLNIESEANASSLSSLSRTDCVEQVVRVGGQLAAVLTQCGAMRLSQCFKRGRQGMFEDVPARLSLRQRQYLPLFLAVVQQRATVDLTDIGSSYPQLWLLSLVKPVRYLGFEHELAAVLGQQTNTFVPGDAGQSLRQKNYGTPRHLFAYALSWMRRSLREAPLADKKKLSTEFDSALQTSMQLMRDDLRTLEASGDGHGAYVSFVRRIISLIRAHGGDICTIPNFFYEISKEYSPPLQDPQLQVASIESYGIRLLEGDAKAAPQLFFYLYNNFKQALHNGKLGHEVAILREGMKVDAVLSFSLGKMVPAILQAATEKHELFVIFDVFCEAIRLRLAQSPVSCQIGEDALSQIPAMVHATLRWAAEVRRLGEMPLPAEKTHLFRKILFLFNTLQPVLEAYSLSMHEPACWEDLETSLELMSKTTREVEETLDSTPSLERTALSSTALFAGLCEAPDETRPRDTHVDTFATSLVRDAERNWVVTPDTITVQGPVRATQSGQGSRRPVWIAEVLLESLHGELRRWNWWWSRCRPGGLGVGGQQSRRCLAWAGGTDAAA
ncbi:hypothetical protein SODALDRAFT_329167 [Sodiomyces alkalinus F11]|uniref:Mus7/MMS22 family protein n=1 Tax=Sodiomyces alkalinus (strain CBS 110278 / VKM F-3762 / F11) TaxID=1314773 RepID=A0A3N2PKB4_SODAK|nr:hypothetical protein SODALDRAFT_329167 [Sodiomyces alkalinus F11]ROT34967.1 hypothetical protein SODALDRAFT_329167 [Sodiomyces alkalinus F11]